MRRRDDRGSATIETLVVLPAVVLFLSLAVLGGRLALAQQAVQAAAADAARSASIARTQTLAHQQGRAAGQASLANQQLACQTTTVTVDTSQFNRPVGTPAVVTATVVCEVPAADLGIPGTAGAYPVRATALSPLDLYRQRA